MSESKMDDLKGRAKEALGSLTDDEDLKKEGRTDQRGAKVKEGIEKVGDKAKDVVDDVKRRND
jgi:uncharacterized protein YjbJ (UPF0337 family)